MSAAPVDPNRRLKRYLSHLAVIGGLVALGMFGFTLFSYLRLPSHARGYAIRGNYAVEIAALERALATTPVPATVPALRAERSILETTIWAHGSSSAYMVEDKLASPTGSQAGDRTSMSSVYDGGTFEITAQGISHSGYLYHGTCTGAGGKPMEYLILFDGATMRR